MDLTYYDKMALSTFSSLEKQSLYQLLCGAMLIDGKKDAREIAIINEIKQIMSITDADVEASRNLTESTTSNCLRNMDLIKKAYVGKFIAQIIIADGVVTPKEEKFFYFMHNYLGLPAIE